MFMGDRIIVQPAKQPARRDRDRDDYGRGPRGRDRDRDGYGPRGGYERGPRQPRGPRRGQYRLIIFNLPEGTSWQDLKDIGRDHGHVTFSDINPAHPDEGALEFDNRDDYERALARIEGTEFRGVRLRVEPDGEVPPPLPADEGYVDRRERSPDSRYRYDDYRSGDRYRDEPRGDRYRGDRYRSDRYRDNRYRDNRREAPREEPEAATDAPPAPVNEEGSDVPPPPPQEEAPAAPVPADEPASEPVAEHAEPTTEEADPAPAPEAETAEPTEP